MRGKHAHHLAHHGRVRIIPAHAGQTPERYAGCRGKADHPRACGANHRPLGVDELPAGSSPRMRGKPVQVGDTGVRGRIIPAHAGQTWASRN